MKQRDRPSHKQTNKQANNLHLKKSIHNLYTFKIDRLKKHENKNATVLSYSYSSTTNILSVENVLCAGFECLEI